MMTSRVEEKCMLLFKDHSVFTRFQIENRISDVMSSVDCYRLLRNFNIVNLCSGALPL
jgi:hypothetical protein